MYLKTVISKSVCYLRVGAVALSALQLSLGSAWAASFQCADDTPTRTPIKHVIVIIGENRTFDHVFATYKPKKGETVDNLLSKEIINEEGRPGPNFSLAVQYSAIDTHGEKYQVSPPDKSLYQTLPPPLVGGPKKPYFKTVAEAEVAENGLPADYLKYLTTGGTGQKSHTPDLRIPHVKDLAPGPFQLTSPSFPYDAYAASPVHRFYQMWQQLDCNVYYATERKPSGCKSDLFSWVEVSVGAGTNGKPQAKDFNDRSTGEGSTALGFYNMLRGDAPYFKELADNYAISDNFHQSVMGGTGANHVMLGTGDAIWFSDGKGNPAVPPHNQLVAAGSANAGVVDEVENPDAAPGTNNWYTEDGYGGGSYGSPSFGGGTYSDCSDPNQPGVASVLNYLSSLPRPVNPNCQPGHYYLLNNYNPGYFGDGTNAYTNIGNPNNTVFTIPPSPLRNIGDVLLENHVSFAYFGDQFNLYKNDPYDLNPLDAYCNICNFFQYSTSIMTNEAVRNTVLKDTLDLYQDIKDGNLPAVSFVKPSGFVDGHPASSKLDLFEGFTKKIVDLVKSNPALWKNTAIFVTFDEGGGYYDSGYVQPLDFFGDGTRIPLIVVSQYTKPGHISHDYSDHVSILKFIERNWRVNPITDRSRDNLPDPKYNLADSKYAPTNSPAIGDLMDLFDFK
ncbi:MAG: phosphoesterase [Acidobacteriaceae bacterium]|nr:phosphoesterase [Acidobacteriaceae bacterium]MBV9779913.1 phosphoesterase [Acidobacteriaceae bacterium]